MHNCSSRHERCCAVWNLRCGSRRDGSCRPACRRSPVLRDGRLVGGRGAPAHPWGSGESFGGPTQCGRSGTGACGRGRRPASQPVGILGGAGYSGAARRYRRGLPTPAWHHRRTRCGGDHHGLLGRLSARVSGVLRRR